MEYELFKWVHILSATLLFGTGLGSAFYKLCADRSGHLPTIYHTNKIVVIADWIFTTPTVFIQPITGIVLARSLGIPLTESWLLASIALFMLAGLCWLVVVWLQIRMRDLALQAIQQKRALDDTYHRYARLWFVLGIPAFSAIVIVYFLMVTKYAIPE